MAREGLMDDCGYEPYVDEEAWDDGFKAGFLMAIDEFAEKCKENVFCKTFGLREVDIDKIAEQLKEE